MNDYTVINISDKIDLRPIRDFAITLPQIRKSVPDLPADPEQREIQSKYYNDNNSNKFLAFGDDEDVKHLFKDFHKAIDLEMLSYCLIYQRPGTFTGPHYDSFFGYCDRFGIDRKHAPHIQRHVVFLDEWKWGQIFCFPTSVYANWRMGDMITWPYKTTHSTATAGLAARTALTVTGIDPDVWRQINA
jgi:hypothetical protein